MSRMHHVQGERPGEHDEALDVRAGRGLGRVCGLGLWLASVACGPTPGSGGSSDSGTPTSATAAATEAGVDTLGATSMAGVSVGEPTSMSPGDGDSAHGTSGEAETRGDDTTLGDDGGRGTTSTGGWGSSSGSSSGTTSTGDWGSGSGTTSTGGSGSSSGSSSGTTSTGCSGSSSGSSSGTTSTGDWGSSSGPGSSSGEPEDPVSCLDPLAGIAWAGDWGKIYGNACMYTVGVPDPVIVDATGFGSDCMILMADVWIPGITDVDGNQALIRTDIFFEDPLGVEPDYHQALGFEGRFGNNYRYRVNFQGGWLWALFPFGDYDLRFRFSHLDENIGCWYTIGLGDGPDGGAPRTVQWQP